MSISSAVKRSRAQVRMPLLRFFSLLLIGSLLLVPAGAFAAPEQAPSNAPLASKVVLFASDGMRPDLVDKYIAEGAMPTYASLIANGVKAKTVCCRLFRPIQALAGTPW